MDSSDLENRRKQLSDLGNFIDESKTHLKSVLDTLGWSVENLAEQEYEMVCCPLNVEHRMPASSLAKHMEKCTLHKEGYNSDDEFLSPSEFSSCPAVCMDARTQASVLQEVSATSSDLCVGLQETSTTRAVPRTSNRLFTDFTAAERHALHSYVVSETRRGTAASDFSVGELFLPFPEDDKKSRPKSKLELLAEQRNAKRRRANYKKVHTSKKTPTELLREVIGSQMEYLLSQDTTNTEATS